MLLMPHGDAWQSMYVESVGRQDLFLHTWTPNMMRIYAYYLWSSQQLSQSLGPQTGNLPLTLFIFLLWGKVIAGEAFCKRGLRAPVFVTITTTTTTQSKMTIKCLDLQLASQGPVQINLCTLSLLSLNLNVKQEGWHTHLYNCYAQHNMTKST